MNEVYVLVEGNWQAYEGGGDTILGVYSSEELALPFVEAYCAYRNIGVPVRNERGEWVISEGASETWLAIQKHSIDRTHQIVGGWVQCIKEFHSPIYPAHNYGVLNQIYRVTKVVSWSGAKEPLYYELEYFDNDRREYVALCEIVNIERFRIMV